LNYINIYVRLIKDKKNYNFFFYNTKKKILLILNINYNSLLIKNYNLYLKLIKSFFFENGLKILLFENWVKYGIKYNLILNLLVK
jgi:hypothetical protein